MNKNAYFCCYKGAGSMMTSFIKYLTSIGITPIRQDNSSISFEHESLKYLFVYEDKDPYYFRLILPNIINVTNDNEQKIKDIINSMNIKFKVVKNVIVDTSVWVSIEQFVYSKENIEELFKRSISLLETLIENFRVELAKE